MTAAALYAACNADDPEPALRSDRRLASTYAADHGLQLDDEFVDTGDDADKPFATRRRARMLLNYVADPRCSVDVVVVVDPTKVFLRGDLATALALLEHSEVALHVVGVGEVKPRSRRAAGVERELSASR